jgi:hypothetical protein
LGDLSIYGYPAHQWGHTIFLYFLPIDVKQNGESTVSGICMIAFIIVDIHFILLSLLQGHICHKIVCQMKLAGQSFIQVAHVFVDFLVVYLCIDTGGSPIRMSKQFAYRFQRNTLRERNYGSIAVSCHVECNSLIYSAFQSDPFEVDISLAATDHGK